VLFISFFIQSEEIYFYQRPFTSQFLILSLVAENTSFFINNYYYHDIVYYTSFLVSLLPPLPFINPYPFIQAFYLCKSPPQLPLLLEIIYSLSYYFDTPFQSIDIPLTVSPLYPDNLSLRYWSI
jgi:hypothetical protein